MSEDKLEVTQVESSCTPDPQIQLLHAWMSRDLPTFCHLLKNPGVSADHWYEDHFATCLYLTCKEDDGAQYASALLQAGAQPNNMNGIRRKAPIHIAAESARVEVLKVLLSHPCTDVNILNYMGNTPLHLIAKQNLKGASEDIVNKYKHCTELLMTQSGIDLNIVNTSGYTAVHFGALSDAKVVVQTILENAGDDLDVDSLTTSNGKSARDTILQKYPEFADLLSKHGRDGDTKQTIHRSILFQYLYDRDFDAFIAAIPTFPNEELEKSNGRHTLLQYCAKAGLERPAIALLDRGVNPNATCQGKRYPPALLACHAGHPAILKLFLKNGPQFVNWKAATVGGGTALHAVLKTPKPDRYTVHKDYKSCLDLLLKHLPELRIDINAVDLQGNTALYYAVLEENDYAVLTLLKHGAYIGIKNIFGIRPIDFIAPKVLEAFLNDCLDTNGIFPGAEAYEVTFSYNFLVPPPRQCCMLKEQNSHTAMELPLDSSQSSGEKPAHQKMATAPTNTETKPLLYISQSQELRHLLKHPIFTSFLELNWHCISTFFYINLILYILFVASLTLYILFGYEKPHIIDSCSTTLTEESGGEALAAVKNNMSGVWRVLSIIFLILLMLREVFQLVLGPSKYLRSPENYLKFLLLITSASILFCDWAHYNTRPHISAIVILLSWAELVLLLGRHPRLSTYIAMFEIVSWNFLKFLVWYAILIIGFALSFYILFRGCGSATNCGEGGDSDGYFFRHFGTSLFKTTIMPTGESDAASIPFVSLTGTSHIIFVLFIFLPAIVLLNLLNGLAVSDSQTIRDDAEIVGYVARVKFLSHIETLFQCSSLPFLGTLKRRCSCCPKGSNSLQSIKNRFCIFPNHVTDNKIRVLPNLGSRIIFTSHQKMDQEEEKGRRYFLHECRACILDSATVKRAMVIINNRGNISETDEMKTLLTLNQKKLEECEKRFDRIENSWEENKVMLERILNTLLECNSSKTSFKK